MTLGLGLVGVVLFTPAARAHDPYESWSSASLFPDRLELGITLAQSTALKLVDPQRNIRDLTHETFPRHRALFEREAAALFIVTAGRKRLVPRQVAAELTEENDVTFKVTYPRPPAGPLHFHAAFLDKLGEGYGGILEIAESTGKQVGWEQLSWANPNFEVTVTAPVPAKAGQPARK